VRFTDAADRWSNLHGGSVSELWRAVHYGPFVFRKVSGDLYVDPEPSEARASPARPKSPTDVPLVNGVYQHGQECDCEWCSEAELA
jgi:hypothetical protein